MFDTNLEIAGILIGIKSDMPLFVEKRMKPFLKECNEKVDVQVIIKNICDDEVDNLKKDCDENYDKYYYDEHVELYRNEKDCISLYKMKRGRKIGRLFVEDVDNGMFKLYADIVFSEMFETEGKYIQFISLEKLLLLKDAFYLHSSLIKVKDRAFMFSGPSGIGKSTQADLWKKYKDAKILNGDRSIIRKINGEYRAYGSPFAGSSNIFVNDSSLLSGIIFIKQGTENKLNRLDEKTTFKKLYSQSMLTGIQSQWLEIATSLLDDIAKTIPVYEYTCTPTKEAVEYLEKAL